MKVRRIIREIRQAAIDQDPERVLALCDDLEWEMDHNQGKSTDEEKPCRSAPTF